MMGCITQPDLCGVGAVFLIAGFYYPYGILLEFLPDLGAIDGLAVSTYVIPILGVLMHAGLGALIGYARRHKTDSWWTTLPAGVAIGVMMTIVPSMLIISFQPPL